jgi:beta-glucanase (GH16 family)
MKLLAIMVSLLLSSPASSDAPASAFNPQSKQNSAYVPEGYGCIWHDEFDGVNCNENGCEISQEFWQFQNLNVNNEKMLYTKRQCTDFPSEYNYCVRDGVFSIHVRDEGRLVRCDDVDCADDYGWPCESGTGCADREERYTSGRVMTKSRFAAKYGYVEVAFRLPFSRQGDSRSGLWPAFWMLDATINEGPGSCGGELLDRSCENAWPSAGEVDILEHVSATPGLLFHNVHWDPGVNGPGWDHKSCDIRPIDVCSENMGWASDVDIDRGFAIDWRDWNVIGVEWQENSIKWVVNGKVNSTMDTTGEEELNREMFPIMNIAVGGNMGGKIDIQDWADAFLEFAYIRWYQEGAENKCGLQ